MARATPTAGLGVVEPPPCPRGWSGHPQKPNKKKRKKKEVKMGFGLLGVASAIPYGWYGVAPPPKAQKKKREKRKRLKWVLGF